MNRLENRMVQQLLELKEKYAVTAVKAEFEAEGTRMEEAMRLKEISLRAGLELTIKVGGCEALKDMFEASSLGTKYLVGPMVESPYALQKYLAATKVAFTGEQRDFTEFFINVETKTAVDNFKDMLKIPEIDQLTGIVIGRHDLCESLGWELSEINSGKMFEICSIVAAQAKAAGLKVVIGGAVSVSARPFFQKFATGHLDKFETRKVVFSCPNALSNPEEAYLKAVGFEIDWLKNMLSYYGSIQQQNANRLNVMEERYKKALALMDAKPANAEPSGLA